MFKGFPITFIDAVDGSLIKEITQRKFYGAVDSMANGKTLGHDGIPIELIK